MTHTEIVQKLIGEIAPVGEHNTDAQRFENLKVMCDLIYDLVGKVEKVATQYKDRPEHSVKKASNFASLFLKNTIGITELL